MTVIKRCAFSFTDRFIPPGDVYWPETLREKILYLLSYLLAQSQLSGARYSSDHSNDYIYYYFASCMSYVLCCMLKGFFIFRSYAVRRMRLFITLAQFRNSSENISVYSCTV